MTLTNMVVSCAACRLDRRIYGNEISFV